MSYASTAILVKSRAKYGKRLTRNDFDQLLSCNTIADIASYLKSNTHYNVSLEGIKEAALHRGNLEALLRSKIFDDFAQLCKFERSVGEHYFEYLSMKNEIDRLLMFLRYFISGTPEKFLSSLPDFFTKYSKIDFVRITESKTFDDVLGFLKGTPYHKLLVPFKQTENGVLDFTTIESVLDSYLYKSSNELIRRNFFGEEQKELLEIFAISGELDNIRKIYRSKQYFNVSEETLISQLNQQSGYLKKRQLNEIIACESADDVIEILKRTRYNYALSATEFSYIDEIAHRILYKFCRRKMCFSKHPAVVMASTIHLFEAEIENITNIIEGKRYGVDSNEIKKLLILE